MKASLTAAAVALAVFPGLSLGQASSFKLLGCFSEGRPSTMNESMIAIDFLTLDSCAQTCIRQKTKYLGLKDGDECLCSNVVNDMEGRAADDSKCDTPCAGYPLDKCGGNNFINIYERSDLSEDDLSSSSSSSSSTTTADGPNPSSPNPSSPNPTSPNGANPTTPSGANPSTPSPTAPNPTAPNPTAPNPTTPNPTAPTPSNPNSANGLLPTKLGALFTAQALLLLCWVAL